MGDFFQDTIFLRGAFYMTKIQEAIINIEYLTLKMESINSLAYLLWDSLANSCNGFDPTLHANGAFLLRDLTDSFTTEFQQAFEALHQSVKEANI